MLSNFGIRFLLHLFCWNFWPTDNTLIGLLISEVTFLKGYFSVHWMPQYE